ncbi:MAG TPA: lamin tail domain-containing protein, partial [Chitinophagaceae bacterium]
MRRLICCLVWLVLSHLLEGQVPARFDVVIHEFFPDPSPVIGLPGSEFIELRNTSGNAFNLRNWKLSDGSTTATITVNYVLLPDSMVIICPASSVSAYAVWGPTIGVSGFPSLNNDGDMIILLSPSGVVIHSIGYDLNWYRNAVKSEGGWTLEMIDAQNPCAGGDNWKASVDARGGTPGRINSITGINSDVQPPALLRTYTVDSITIVVVFDEPLDSTSAATIGHYVLDKGLFVSTAEPLSPTFKQVSLTLQASMLPRVRYTLQVSDVADCSGNIIGIMNSSKAGLPSDLDTSDIIVNEVLFNPSPDGTDYVEFYSKSDKIIDASTLFIANRNSTGSIVSARKMSETPFLIFPGDFIVATADAQLVRSRHHVAHPINLLLVPQLPSFPDDKGNIVLLNQQGTIIDELSYDEKWHFPLIANREGVALERIDYQLPTQHKENWTSAAADAGFGTPTARNSQFKTYQAVQGSIELGTPVFSPDGDGRDDLCFIHYEFANPNNVANVTVFDINGIPVRKLYSNITLSEKGVFRWDGLDDRGRRS